MVNAHMSHMMFGPCYAAFVVISVLSGIVTLLVRIRFMQAGSPCDVAFSYQQRCHVAHLTRVHGLMQPPPLTVAPPATAVGSAAPAPVPTAAKQQWRRCPLLSSRKPARGQAEAAQGWSTLFYFCCEQLATEFYLDVHTHNCKPAHTNQKQPYRNIAVGLLQMELIQNSAMSVSLKS